MTGGAAVGKVDPSMAMFMLMLKWMQEQMQQQKQQVETLPHATGTRLGTRLGMIFSFLDRQCRGNGWHRIKMSLPGQKCLGFAANTGTFDLFGPFLPTTCTTAFCHFRVSAGFCQFFFRFSRQKCSLAFPLHKTDCQYRETQTFLARGGHFYSIPTKSELQIARKNPNESKESLLCALWSAVLSKVSTASAASGSRLQTAALLRALAIKFFAPGK